ncbi:hypothetical protein [Oceanobacillus manasiensis]|uniref:hypothetical protein n=1 Tax=Oceanobacillus manasiensis TaxID=586413 RepID=UPI0005A66CEA|nr:hypothetical protein [Oceanobacillus manasiensis]
MGVRYSDKDIADMSTEEQNVILSWYFDNHGINPRIMAACVVGVEWTDDQMRFMQREVRRNEHIRNME